MHHLEAHRMQESVSETSEASPLLVRAVASLVVQALDYRAKCEDGPFEFQKGLGIGIQLRQLYDILTAVTASSLEQDAGCVDHMDM